MRQNSLESEVNMTKLLINPHNPMTEITTALRETKSCTCKAQSRQSGMWQRGMAVRFLFSTRQEAISISALKIAAVLVTQKRGFNARPMEKDLASAKPHRGNFAGIAPVE